MDGNGRWANARSAARRRSSGGARAARAIVESARETGIRVLTVFAFSSENWQRPRAEVRLLLDLFRRTIQRELGSLHDNNVRLSFIGERDHFSAGLQRAMETAETRTRDNDGLDLVVAVDFGGRWDVVRAAREMARDCAAGRLDPDGITEAVFGRYRSLAHVREPDLFIRTGGERRISNFLLWDLAYSELYFTDRLWPDFDREALEEAIDWYARRERRFGRLPEAAAPGR